MNAVSMIAQPESFPLRLLRFVNVMIAVGLAWFFFLAPGLTALRFIRDPGSRSDRIPEPAFAWHRTLSPKYEAWAEARVAGGDATQLSIHDISGTEWPLFGTVFYLWATESLQDAWDGGQRSTKLPPKEYAQGAIDAAIRLVIDPGHASWVKQHWGEAYLTRENVFYRMLLIGGITSHIRLTDDRRYEPILREQVETLSAELDASPFGLLDDYPGECYPTDILAAWAVIREADEVLGTDHTAFARRAQRAFRGPLLDPVGLPPYAANPLTGQIYGRSRGCGNSFMLIHLPDLWPDLAPVWYDAYETHFWQHNWTAVGFREFPKDEPNRDWYADVDAGPVIAGHGIAACAFGVGAARAHGRIDHAYPLTVEMILMSWPLPNHTLLLPRLLSNATDAPYLGEVGVLYALTRPMSEHVTLTKAGGLPPFVWIVLTLYLGLGLLLLFTGWRRWKHRHRRMQKRRVPLATVQFGLWLLLIVGSVLSMAVGFSLLAPLFLLMALVFPFTLRNRKAATPESAAASTP